MKLSEYQEIAAETAFYPEELALYYCALGLSGESGEVADKVKKIIRDKGGFIKGEDRVAMAKELGDVLWYVANMSRELGFCLSEVAEMNVSKLRDRQRRDMLSGSGDDR